MYVYTITQLHTHILYTHARALAHIISSGMFPISQKFNYLGEKITKKFLIMHFKKKRWNFKTAFESFRLYNILFLY